MAYDAVMSDQVKEQAPADQAGRAQANGQAPAVSPEECEDCVSAGERGLGALAILFGLLIVAMGVDMAFGGVISSRIPQRGQQS